MSIDVDYENPWFFEGVPFLSENINDNFGFVYSIIKINSSSNCFLYFANPIFFSLM
jgi:hypothetical protein